jgi:hypothetical protein
VTPRTATGLITATPTKIAITPKGQSGDADRARSASGCAGDQTTGDQSEPVNIARRDVIARGVGTTVESGDRRHVAARGRARSRPQRDADARHAPRDQRAVGEDQRPVGQVDAHHAEQGVDALGHGDAAADPAADGEHAIDQRFTERPKRRNLLRVGTDRAQQASSRVRWLKHDGEGVVDDEDRHEQRDAAEAQQDVADDVDLVGEVGGRLASTVALSTTSAAGTARATAAWTGATSAPSATCTATLSMPSMPNSSLAWAVFICMSTAPSVELSAPNEDVPDRREVDTAVRHHELVRVTDDEAVLGGGSTSIVNSPTWGGHRRPA